MVGVARGKPLLLSATGLEVSPIYYAKAEKVLSVNDQWVEILSVVPNDDPKDLVLDVKLRASDPLKDAYAIVSYLARNEKGHSWPACQYTELPELTGELQEFQIRVPRKDIRDGEWRLHVYHTGAELYDRNRTDLVDASPEEAFRLNLRRHLIVTGAGDAPPVPFYMPVSKPPDRLLPENAGAYVVKVRVKIGKDGKVAEFDFADDLNPGLADFLSKSVEEWLFFPQVKQGQTVERTVSVPLQLK